ncbi:hypothetical protein [Cerasicoccus frondis]|uniref:hypothetical protein n=1 Tax=Cerasicoccus frondis TaxID=490090 RepID=UPI0028526353|nr:hypothetical protein [Cerasicoccus frondis]
MAAVRYRLMSLQMLKDLFHESLPSYLDFDGNYDKSFYGSLKNLMEMPEYELAFSPYVELAKSCGMTSMSLKRSLETGRLYLWNVNLGGHAPMLELRPVKLDHVLDLNLMKRLHENWARLLGCDIDDEPGYLI